MWCGITCPRLFQGYTVKNCHAIRVTRDSDLPVEEDPFEDLLKTVEESLRDRRRGAVVRLQYEHGLSARRCWTLLIEEMELAPRTSTPAAASPPSRT